MKPPIWEEKLNQIDNLLCDLLVISSQVNWGDLPQHAIFCNGLKQGFKAVEKMRKSFPKEDNDAS